VLLDRRLNRITGPAIDEQVRFLLGGFCADRRLNLATCDRRNSAVDFGQVLKLVPRDERRWHRLLTESDLLVMKCRAAIQNVAYELLEREVLNPMQVASIIQKSSTPRDR
jgi:hypothetical protein